MTLVLQIFHRCHYRRQAQLFSIVVTVSYKLFFSSYNLKIISVTKKVIESIFSNLTDIQFFKFIFSVMPDSYGNLHRGNADH